MVFSIILIVLLAAIVFIHFIQGMFSAMLSAFAAVFAAAIALGLNDSVVQMMKPGKFADSATGMVLCLLFVVSYVVMRVLIDKLVPGNVRLQSTIDKVGAALMGVVAGLFACGIIAIAAQTMPFGPSIFGYSRFELSDSREATFGAKPGESQMVRSINDEVKGDTFAGKQPQKLLLPVDDIVLSTVAGLSDGSLATGRHFDEVYPDYLAEVFGQRLGLEPGAKHTATNWGSQQNIGVTKVIVRDRLKQVETAELPEIRAEKRGSAPPVDINAKEEAKIAKQDLQAPKGGAILILRVDASDDTRDKDKMFRFAMGNIRLVLTGKDGKTRDVYPVGTFDTWSGTGVTNGPGTVWPNRVGDPLFANNQGMDLVFVVDDANAVLEQGSGKPKAGNAKALVVKPGVFLEVKRYGKVDLSGMDADQGPVAPNPQYDILRKIRLKAPPAPQQG